MHPSREQIAEVIEATYEDEYGLPAAGTFEDCADAVLALWQPHTITTREELDALPDGAVILTGEPYIAYTRFGHRGWENAGNEPMSTFNLGLPATVLWVPEVAG